MKILHEQPNIKIGDTVWWIHCSNQIYKGTVKEYVFCEMQGAVYLSVPSPAFKLNKEPLIHYSHCFTSYDAAEDARDELKKTDETMRGMMRCDRCKLNTMNDEAR